MILTPEQLQEISRIVEDRHTAFIANTMGVDALAPEVVGRLRELGLLDVKVDSVKDAYLYGQVIAAGTAPDAQNMTYEAFKTHIRKNPIPLTPIEQDALWSLRQHGAQYVKGLGNRVNTQTGEVIINADAELRQQMRDTIRTTTEEGIAKRKSRNQIKSDLGWATKDWTRDWERIANTEKAIAMGQGTKDYIAKRHGPEAKVAVRVAPTCCPTCCKLFKKGEIPIIFSLEDLEGNGTNYGRKQANWEPVVPPAHPNCFLKDTQVLTQRGDVGIESVRPGDFVLSHDGSWQPVTHTWRSFYKGQIVRIQFEDGSVVSSTEGHPHVGPEGLVSASLTQQGMDLLHFPFDVRRAALVECDRIDNPPERLQDLKFASILFGFSWRGVPITAIDLHGEFYVREGHIDEAAANLIAGLRSQSAFDKSVVDYPFRFRFEFTSLPSEASEDKDFGLRLISNGGMKSSDISPPLFWRHFRHADSLPFGSIPRCPSCGTNTFDDDRPRPASFSRYLFYRQQLVEVHMDSDVRGKFGSFSLGTHSDYRPTPQPIVNVDSFHFEGDVYNLSIKNTHTYTVNGLVTHNCQCILISVPAGFGFDETGHMVAGGERNEMGKSEVYWSLKREGDLRKALRVAFHVTFQGIPIVIENPAGTIRRWDDGEESGQTEMLFAYGYIANTEGDDTDEIDVFLGPSPMAPTAFIVHQQNPKNGLYDENKVMLGFDNERDALTAYQKHYNRSDFVFAISPMPLDALKRWVSGTASRPDELIKGSQSLVVALPRPEPVEPLVKAHLATTPKKLPKLILDPQLSKANVQSAGTVRSSEDQALAFAPSLPNARQAPGNGAGINLMLGNLPTHRPPPVDFKTTGNPYTREGQDYAETAVKRDPGVYEYQEPAKPRKHDLELVDLYAGSVLGIGETERNRAQVERHVEQKQAVIPNTVEPKEIPAKKKKDDDEEDEEETSDTSKGEILH